uniref:Secreted protein n=1 Tax=Ixodes ricinus TaxID=34613 RepID=A0A6B0UTS2_IXORI
MHFFPFASSSCPFFFFAPFLCVVFRYACACVGVCACVQRFAVDGFNCAMMAAPFFRSLYFFFFFKDVLSFVCFKKFPTKTGCGVAEKKNTFGQNVGGTPNRLARRRRRFMRPPFVSSFSFFLFSRWLCSHMQIVLR